MQRSLFLSITSAAALATGCSDDCGPMGASTSGLVIGNDQVTLTYGGLAASANNDCPDANAPKGVVSLTITGTGTTGSGFFTICVPRPDLFAKMSLTLGTDVQLVDVTGADANGCTYTLDRTRPPSGTARGEHMCANGTSKAGFALTFQGAFLNLSRTCQGTTTSVAVSATGPVAVAGP
jgi:hypothetical protein